MRQPLCIDLFCGLGGFSEGFLAEGWRVVGFDIERHRYPHHMVEARQDGEQLIVKITHGWDEYPGQLVLQDVLTLHGSQFRHADCIVASPPCQEFSYMAMPWKRAKAIAAALRGQGAFPDNYRGSRTVEELTRLFDACFRLQREACEAAGRHIPLIVENVRGAQPWVGPAKYAYGSFLLWGDVPALMPSTRKQKNEYLGGGSWFPQGNGATVCGNHGRDGRKVPGLNFHEHAKTGKPGRSFQSAAVEGVKQAGLSGPAWFDHGAAAHSSRSNARKAASALIAKIPRDLSLHLARVFKRMGRMNERVKRLMQLARGFRVRAVVTTYDYDPAGSSTTYSPHGGDLALLSAMTGRAVTERDLRFNIGCGYSERDYYGVPDALLEEAIRHELAGAETRGA